MEPSATIFRFGPYESRSRTRELYKHGLKLKVRPQPLQVLNLLLSRAGEMVTREELRDRLWSPETFVDFDHNLNTCIREIRAALSDSSAEPRYIETLPRLGYRFVATVEVVEPSSEPPPTEPSERPDTSVAPNDFFQNAAPAARRFGAPGAIQRVARRRWLWALGICLIAIGVLAYGFLSPQPIPRVTRFVQGGISDRADAFAHLVTDGTRVYFLERTGDHSSLAQTSMAGGEPHVIQAPFRSTRVLDASPDRTEFLIGDFEVRDSGMPLWIWPAQGGSPTRVGDVTVRDASWCLSGQEIVYSRDHNIRIVRRDGTGDRILIHTPGDPGWMHWSPDGRRLTYTVEDPQSDAKTLWEASADGSHAHMRFPGWGDPPSECCSEWTPDGKYLVFTSSRNGIPDLWAVREDRQFLHWKAPRPIQLTPTATPLWGSLLTRNGTRIFAYGWSEASNVGRLDLGSSRLKPETSLGGALHVSFSKDGTWMAFVAPDLTLWRSKEDGSDRVQLVASPLRTGWPRWSPDGSKITFEAHVHGKPVRAYVVSAAGGPVQEIFAQEGEQSVPTWSPDGEQIALALNVGSPPSPSAPRGIYIVNWKSHEATKVPGSEGFTSPLWSPDGRYFTAKTADEDAILLFDDRTKKWTTIATGTALSGLTWSPDSKYLYVQKITDAGEPIYRLRAGDFEPERIRDLEPLLDTGILQCVFDGFAPDGSLILVMKRGESTIYAIDVELP